MASADKRKEETQKLFGNDGEYVPSVQVEPEMVQQQYDFQEGNDTIPSGIPTNLYENTLDESAWETFKRDFIRIGKNLRIVLFPFNLDKQQQQRALKNWDLWGPLIFIILLMILMVAGEKEHTETIATAVFSIIGIGALVLTINVELIGGTIVFFQSLCLLGYCLFPLIISAAFCVATKSGLIRWITVVIALVWSCYAAVPFIAESVPPKRKSLAIYPVLLLYICVAWMELVK